MKLSVDYKHKDLSPEKIAEGKEKEKNIVTTTTIIEVAMAKAHPEGFDGNGPMRRMWGRLLKKFDTAVEADINELDLEDAEVDLIKKALLSAKLPLQWSNMITMLEEALESKPNELDKAETTAVKE